MNTNIKQSGGDGWELGVVLAFPKVLFWHSPGDRCRGTIEKISSPRYGSSDRDFVSSVRRSGGFPLYHSARRSFLCHAMVQGCSYISNISVPYDNHLRYRPLLSVYDVARLKPQYERTFIVRLCSFRSASSGT